MMITGSSVKQQVILVAWLEIFVDGKLMVKQI